MSAVKGVMNVYTEKSRSTNSKSATFESAPVAPVVSTEVGQQQPRVSYASDSYQKILDYHVAEIFLTTIVFAVIVLLRLHH